MVQIVLKPVLGALFVASLLVGSGCGVVPEDAAKDDVQSSSSALSTAKPDVENPDVDYINTERGIPSDPTAAYGCNVDPKDLCLGRCQSSGGIFVVGDRSTVGWGNCAARVKAVCDRNNWGYVTLACWGH